MATKLENYYEELLKLETPSKSFDRNYYLKNNPDVARDKYFGSRPEEHYERNGRNEGRLPSQAAEDLASGVTGRKIAELKTKIQQEEGYNSLSSKIQGLTSGGMQNPNAGPAFNQALSQLSADRNYGSSDLGSMLNFQVSDDQIVQDYNNSKLSSLNSVIDRGNTQIAGINEQLATANKLLAELPAGSAQRTSSEAFIKELNDDLKSVTSAVTSAQDMKKNFKPITMDSPEGLKEITSFRSFVQLPEERASQQLFQIDPDSYRT